MVKLPNAAYVALVLVLASWAVAVSIGGLLVLSPLVSRIFGVPPPQWVWRGAFLLGLLTLAAYTTGALFVLTRGLMLGISFSGLVVFGIVAIETGIAGYFAFSSQWRYAPLFLTLLGVIAVVFLGIRGLSTPQ